MSLLKGMDFMVPALEDIEALNALAEAARRADVPFAAGLRSYSITSSKDQINFSQQMEFLLRFIGRIVGCL